MLTRLIILLIIGLKSCTKASINDPFYEKPTGFWSVVISSINRKFQRVKQYNIFAKNNHQPKVKNI